MFTQLTLTEKGVFQSVIVRRHPNSDFYCCAEMKLHTFHVLVPPLPVMCER